MKLSPKERQQRHRDKILALGLCTVCKERPYREGRLACQECADKQSEAERQKRLDRRTAKVCFQCGDPERKPGTSLCHKCHRDMAERSRKARKSKREEKLLNRQCCDCTKPAKYGKAYCARCLINHRLRRYGLTLEQFDALGNECKICHGTENLHIDHDHKTNKVRSLLCQNCNRGLGLFKDSPELLRRAADYLQQDLTGATQVLSLN